MKFCGSRPSKKVNNFKNGPPVVELINNQRYILMVGEKEFAGRARARV